jgi:asparagine synthase (glutamine-hydrolysing)
MAGIAGVTLPGHYKIVNQMLEKMAHRAAKRAPVKVIDGVTIGLCWPDGQPGAEKVFADHGISEDYVSNSHYARALIDHGVLILTRDPLGVSPLYYGYTDENATCFASEVKALLGLVSEVHELLPGCILKNGKVSSGFQRKPQKLVEDEPLIIAAELRRRLEKAVKIRAERGVPFGAWLSGGLDSSIMSALARPFTNNFHTFSAGFDGADDLDYARLVSRHIRSTHHQMVPTVKEVIKVIPEVIYHLESFDALLIRSSLMNYLVAKMASDYVPAVFSGEGGDELFGGYHYLKQLSLEELPGELLDITARLHNTALQRVDRCAAAHGTVAYLGFLDIDVVDYAFKIPPEYKIYNGLEKWILRRSVFDLLPERVVLRGKAKFWEGAGVHESISNYAAEKITDSDFHGERFLPNGDVLNTKEELYYFRIFKEYFSAFQNIDWIGRTKGSPKEQIQ